jgi:hypothetical protein
VDRSHIISVDLETSYLHIKTNSSWESAEWLWLDYYDSEWRWAGGFSIKFPYPLQYNLHFCEWYTPFLAEDLPPERDKVWTIVKRGYRTTVYCNSVLLVDFTVSNVTCRYDANWDTYWRHNVKRLGFNYNYDLASDKYFIG